MPKETPSHRKSIDTKHNSETEPLLPPTEITILFAPHQSREHAQGLRQHLKPGTLYLPEFVGLTPQEFILLQQVADGQTSPDLAIGHLTPPSFDMRGFLYQMLEEIHGTGVIIGWVDVSLEDENTSQFLELDREEIYAQTFAETLEAILKDAQRYTQLQHQREAIMVQRLKQLLKHQAKDKYQIVMTIGSSHRSVLAKLDAERQHFAELRLNPVFHPDGEQHLFHQEDLYQVIKSGQEVSHELLSRVLLEKLILGSHYRADFDSVLKDPAAVLRFVSSIAAKCSLEEIQQFYQDVMSTYLDRTITRQLIVIGQNKFSALGLVATDLLASTDFRKGLFEEKGIEFPDAPAEDDDYGYINPWV